MTDIIGALAAECFWHGHNGGSFGVGMEHCLGQLGIHHEDPGQPLYKGPEHLADNTGRPAAMCCFILSGWSTHHW